MLPFIFLLLWVSISEIIEGYIVIKVILFFILYSVPISYAIFKGNILEKFNFGFKKEVRMLKQRNERGLTWMNKQKVVAIIPARGGSKEFRGKI